VVVERATKGGSIATSRFAEGWAAGLDAYLASAAEDGRLSALGERMVQDTATSRLVAGVKTADAIARRPGLPATLQPPPIVIVGGWRTGTTFLFRLLATDPRLHAPLPAELGAPWRFAGADRPTRDQLVDAAASAHELLPCAATPTPPGSAEKTSAARTCATGRPCSSSPTATTAASS
jgi:hypothetical protein